MYELDAFALRLPLAVYRSDALTDGQLSVLLFVNETRGDEREKRASESERELHVHCRWTMNEYRVVRASDMLRRSVRRDTSECCPVDDR